MRILVGLLMTLFAPDTFSQNRYDVVIDEIMADPSPVVGLPNNEWVELKNTSSVLINLQGWRLADASGQSGPMPSYQLMPDSFVILCSSGSVTAMNSFGSVIPVTNFPSLDNPGDLLVLKAGNNKTIHALNYQLSWYQNELKEAGGWSLEMIDPKNPCSGISNWKASVNPTGGTPGRKNSVDGINPDRVSPIVKYAYTTDSTTIILVFNEPVDSTIAASVSLYTIEPGLNVLSAITQSPLFDKVQLRVQSPMQMGTIYKISVSNALKDCNNNPIGNNNHAKLGLPSDPAVFDLVVNEILFDPGPNAFDYVEIYNNSQKVFDASKLYIATRNSSGTISSIQVLAPSPFYFFPGDHLVFTEDAIRLELNYLVPYPEHVFEISSMPSLPDDEGVVILLDAQGMIVDEVRYSSDWHFKLLQEKEGVSLERMDASGDSNDPNNWHSAATTVGYGTPGYTNSQLRQAQEIFADISIQPTIFSPDNDGQSDIAFIYYKSGTPGYVGNINIFDAAGRPVKRLVQNALMGINGYWNWDGLDDKGRQLPLGIYIVFIEIFNLEGRIERYKRSIVLARHLK